MKRFLGKLAGGIIVIAVAILVAIAHNAVRSRPLPLLQRVPASAPGGGAPQGGARGSRPATPEPGGASTATPETGDWTAADVKAAVEAGSIVVIDARSPDAFTDGHIPGAHNIPYDRLPDYYDHLIEATPMDARVVCYCWSETCDFSDRLSTELRIAGYADVHVFKGGWAEWEAAGYRVEAGDGNESGEGGR